MQDCVQLLNDDIAESFSVDRDKLLKYQLAKKIPRNLTDRYLYTLALESCRIKFSVRWKNKLSEDFHDIEAVKKALSSEHSLPYFLSARSGTLGRPSVSIRVRDDLDQPVLLEAEGSRETVRTISEKVNSLLINSTPEFGIIHHPLSKIILIIILFITWFIFLTSASTIFYPDSYPSILQYFNIMGWITSILIGIFLLFRKVFPNVVFYYGSGKRWRAIRKLVFAVFGIVLATFLGWMMTGKGFD